MVAEATAPQRENVPTAHSFYMMVMGSLPYLIMGKEPYIPKMSMQDAVIRRKIQWIMAISGCVISYVGKNCSDSA